MHAEKVVITFMWQNSNRRQKTAAILVLISNAGPNM